MDMNDIERAGGKETAYFFLHPFIPEIILRMAVICLKNRAIIILENMFGHLSDTALPTEMIVT